MEKENKQWNNKEKDEPKNLHTYMSDMAEAIRENEASVVKIALAEQRKIERGDYYRQVKESPKKKSFWAIGGIFIILLAVGISYFVIQKTKEKYRPIEPIKEIKTPVSYEDQIILDLTGAASKTDILNFINPELNKKNPPGTIKALFLKQKTNDVLETLSLEKFFSLLRTSIPNSLIRASSKDYLLGIYTPQDIKKENKLFLIIKINDYSLAYASMLDWEKTILEDLFSLFQISIGIENQELFEKPFKDIIINNKDSRILYTREGDDVLFYLFPDKDNLIITNNQEAIKELITRILIKKTKESL